jgi:CelD/BcsL family acetyltransferase involved in cellulose biosynthesis
VTALTWAIGDLGCPDHLELLAAPGTDLEALVPVLEGLSWQVLILSNLAHDAVNASRLCDTMAGHGYRLRRRAQWGCPYIELPGDWQRYLATLTPTRRQTLGRKERNLQRHHAATITHYDSESFAEGWKALLRLHGQRWVGAGAFRDPRLECLNRRFATELAARHGLWLATLDLEGEPAAVWYGFASGDTVYFYQSGRDPRWDRQSVGMVLMGAMIRRAIERGYRRFDFLRGEEAYKRHWTPTQAMTEEIVIFRPGWRGRWLRALDATAELRARFLRGLWTPSLGGAGEFDDG